MKTGPNNVFYTPTTKDTMKQMMMETVALVDTSGVLLEEFLIRGVVSPLNTDQ